jgi:hypothetical protein
MSIENELKYDTYAFVIARIVAEISRRFSAFVFLRV